MRQRSRYYLLFISQFIYLNEKLQYTTQTFSHPSLSTNNMTISSHSILHETPVLEMSQRGDNCLLIPTA
jgi:hypothetical protein